MNRRRIQLATLAISLGLLWAAAAHSAAPNVVVVMVDDMPAHMLAQMPLTRSVIGSAGVTFNQSFTEFALCCPSRVTFLLGRYAHNHKVESNIAPRGGFAKFKPLEGQTIAMRLQDAGYRTAMIGRYVNQYPASNAPLYVPPGWTTWVALLRNPWEPMTNSPINRNGVRGNLSGYQTDALAAEARNFITQAVNANQPFFVWLTITAPHMPATPAARHANLFSSSRAPRTPAFNEADVSDKPPHLQFPSLTAAEIADADERHRQQLRSLQAVDEAIRSLRDHLNSLGKLNSTYIFFISDNGHHNGEHRMRTEVGGGKQFAYDIDLRTPLLVRGPGVVANRVNNTHMVVNVDLAPTIMQIAGLSSAATAMDGRSLLPLLRGQTPSVWRRSFPIVKYPNPNSALGYIGVHTIRYTWVEWTNGARELYDRQTDPHELTNLASASNLAGLRSTLSAIARRLNTCAGNTCRNTENSNAT
jgi:N-acetylglucosamine-6-sulfatase